MDSNLAIINSFKAHNDYIWKILFVSQFNCIITASNDKTVNVWSTLDWNLTLIYKGHDGGVTSLQYLGKRMIASGSGDWRIHIWNLLSGILFRIIYPGTTPYSINLLANNLLASGLYNGNIKVFNLTNYGLLDFSLSGHSSIVYDLKKINETLLASASNDKSIIVWNLKTQSFLFKLTGHTSSVNALKVLSSTILASGSSDNNIIFWDLEHGSFRALLGHTNRIFHSLETLNSSEQVLVSGSLDNTIKFWNFSSLQLLSSISTNIQINTLIVIGEYLTLFFNQNC
jgi:WD40 repeat protein